jgi:hypothetical protein
MIRHIPPLTLTALLALSSIACEKPGATERQKEQQANEQAAQARNEANEQMQTAQGKADKEIAAARADFEKAREDYRHAQTLNLSDIDRKIAALDAKDKTATGKTKAELDAKLPAIRAQREAFVRELQDVDRATSSTWDDVKANVDRKWDSLNDAVNKAEGSPLPVR